MPEPAALGFKLHTGWAAVVAATGRPDRLKVLFRSRLDLMPENKSIPRFVYHKAAELPFPEASKLVNAAVRQSQTATQAALADVLQRLKLLGAVVTSCGIPATSRELPGNLAAILKSHPLIHAAEGALFHNAVMSACKSHGLPVIEARERELWTCTAHACAVKETALRKVVDGLRQSLGPPWTADYKNATALAVLALRSAK